MRKTFLLLFLIFIMLLTACQSQSFNSETWMTEPDDRSGMVRDLLNRHELVGLTEEEVVALLGEPEAIKSESAIEFEYLIGHEGLMGIKVRLLVLTFDEAGRVTGFRFRSA